MSVAAMAALVRSPAGAGLLSQTWRVSWAILPLSLWHFGATGGYAVVANLIAVPVFTIWVLPLGIGGWLLVPALGWRALGPAEMGAQLILDVAEFFAALPAVPGAVAAVLALLAVGLWLWPRVRSRLERALPPRLACVGVLVVATVPTPSAEVPGWDYAVLGGRSELHRGEWGVCLRDPVAPASGWPRRVRALGAERVTNVVSRFGHDDPHTVDVRRRLAEADLWRPAAGACPRVPAACRRAISQMCPGLTAVVGPDGLHCFARGGWVSSRLPVRCS